MAKRKKRKTKKVVRKKKNGQIEVIETPVVSAISVIICLAVALFLFMSNFDMCGGVGEKIKNTLMLLFGEMAYFVPLVFVFAVLINIYYKRNSRIKNTSIIISFIALTSLLTLIVENENFGTGLVGEFVNRFLIDIFGKDGTIIFTAALFIITLLIYTGIGIYGKIFTFILSVITFLPRKISEISQNSSIDEEIARENEAVFNDRLENKIKPIKEKNIEKTVLEKLSTREKVYSTDNITLDAEKIQSRFFDKPIDSEDRTNKDILRTTMKKKSVNEIIHNESATPDDFFYTDERVRQERLKREEENKSVDEYKPPVEEKPAVDYKPYEEYKPTTEYNNYSEPQTSYEYKPEVKKVNTNYNFNNSIDENKSKLDSATEKISEGFKFNNKNDDMPINRNAGKRKSYKFPSIDLLHRNKERNILDKNYTRDVSEKLKATLEQFGVGVVVTNVSIGPTVTRYELQPNLGVKVSKVLGLQDDIKLALAASDIRIEAPVPGKSAIGIEVPNKNMASVLLGDLIASRDFKDQKSYLSVALGKDISGKNIYADLEKMPHILIAGATGSGKSVCINSIIMSLIYKSAPKDVRFILIDPKVVELQAYNDIPHLLTPVVTDAKKAKNALNWAVNEMSRRYKIFADKQVKDLAGYNQLVDMENRNAIYEDSKDERLPRIVIIIDELADLMMACGKDVENSVVRLAQLSRACGIHLVIATQRPSVNVVTGLIKANVQSRIAFAVSSGVDSRTILDMNGAEDLLGNGDMLYSPSDLPKPLRVQGCFISEAEIKSVVNSIKEGITDYDDTILNNVSQSSGDSNSGSQDDKDEFFYEAGKFCIEQGQPSIGMLQRKFRMGFNRAARVIDQLEEAGVVSKQEAKKPREVTMTMEEFEAKFSK